MTPEIKQALTHLRESGYGAEADGMESALSVQQKHAGVIETHHTDAATEWGYSFTSHNPEPDDYVRCASEADVWKLDKHIRRTGSALASAEPVAYEERMRPVWDERAPWTPWGRCSRESYENFASKPNPWISNDWEIQRRALYTHAQPAAKVEAPNNDCVNCDGTGRQGGDGSPDPCTYCGATGVMPADPGEPKSDAPDSIRWAQRLIVQLPADHDGRNSWLLNHGVGEEADWLRAEWKRYSDECRDYCAGPMDGPKPERRRFPVAPTPASVPDGFVQMPNALSDEMRKVLTNMLTNCRSVDESYADLIRAATTEPTP